MRLKFYALLLSVFAAVSPISFPAMAAGMPVFTLELKDGVFTPNVLNVPADQTFKIIVKNVGSGPGEFESLRLRKEKVLAPGSTSFIVIRHLSPGVYEFFDDFHSDLATARGKIVAK